MHLEELNFIAIRIALTGAFFLALVYLAHAHELSRGFEPPLPWKTMPGAVAHTVFIIGVIAYIWTKSFPI